LLRQRRAKRGLRTVGSAAVLRPLFARRRRSRQFGVAASVTLLERALDPQPPSADPGTPRAEPVRQSVLHPAEPSGVLVAKHPRSCCSQATRQTLRECTAAGSSASCLEDSAPPSAPPLPPYTVLPHHRGPHRSRSAHVHPITPPTTPEALAHAALDERRTTAYRATTHLSPKAQRPRGGQQRLQQRSL
jgi:hypothetical protein